MHVGEGQALPGKPTGSQKIQYNDDSRQTNVCMVDWTRWSCIVLFIVLDWIGAVVKTTKRDQDML